MKVANSNKGNQKLSILLSLGLLLASVCAHGVETSEEKRPAQLERRLEQLLKDIEKVKAEYENATRALSDEQQRLQQRIRELEESKAIQEDATRAIIRDSVTSLGSNINQAVALGGTLEAITGWKEDFSGQSDAFLGLNTLELDFEVLVNEWTLGSFIIEYDDGQSTLFQSTNGFDTAIERVNIDTAFVTIGDLYRFPLALTAGQIIVPFGISTGNPVTDVLTIENPLTIDAFEMRNVAIGFDVAFPTPIMTAPPQAVTPPPVKPVLINPLVTSMAKGMGYEALPVPPPPLTPVTFARPPPPYNMGFYFFDGHSNGWKPGDHYDVTVGYRTKSHCGRPYAELAKGGGWNAFCPWSIDVDVDYNSSVFDSRFFSAEYKSYLNEIGTVPGMAASIKATLGRVSLVGEWNGTLEQAVFHDDLGNAVAIQPSSWQVSMGYQFDWNPWVEAIGEQGSYFALSYSESRDLAGATRLISGEAVRVGSLPKRLFLASYGEWVLDGVKFAFEYSHAWDYTVNEGGTGETTDAVYTTLTYVW